MSDPAPTPGDAGPPASAPSGRRLDLSAKLRIGFKILRLGLVTAVLLPVQMLAVRRGWRLAATLPVWWHGFALRSIGIRLTVHGAPCRDRPLLVTPNHVSWLDITVIGSLMPLSFVSKAEVATWPLFGLFARLQRTVYVDRSRRSETAKVNEAIADRLLKGDAMVLFPEGTSSNGTTVLPFRSALIGAARAAILNGGHERVWVQPLSLGYRGLHGLPLGRAERWRAAWYGAMDLLPHLLGVFADGAFDIEVRWGEPIPFDDTTDRKILAQALERSVRGLTGASLAGREPARGGLPAAAPGHAIAVRP